MFIFKLSIFKTEKPEMCNHCRNVIPKDTSVVVERLDERTIVRFYCVLCSLGLIHGEKRRISSIEDIIKEESKQRKIDKKVELEKDKLTFGEEPQGEEDDSTESDI